MPYNSIILLGITENITKLITIKCYIEPNKCTYLFCIIPYLHIKTHGNQQSFDNHDNPF